MVASLGYYLDLDFWLVLGYCLGGWIVVVVWFLVCVVVCGRGSLWVGVIYFSGVWWLRWVVSALRVCCNMEFLVFGGFWIYVFVLGNWWFVGFLVVWVFVSRLFWRFDGYLRCWGFDVWFWVLMVVVFKGLLWVYGAGSGGFRFSG